MENTRPLNLTNCMKNDNENKNKKQYKCKYITKNGEMVERVRRTYEVKPSTRFRNLYNNLNEEDRDALMKLIDNFQKLKVIYAVTNNDSNQNINNNTIEAH